MKTTKIGYLTQVSFLPRLFPVNCYLVEEEDGLTLIDAALPYSAKGILEAARRIGKPIKRIVLTHAHDDHVGALDVLKRELPEANVYISARDARLLAGDVSLDPEEEQTPVKGGVPKKTATRPDVLLRDGDQVGSLLAVATPGHTPGAMSFLDVRDRALIVGDAFQTRAGLAVSGQLRLLFPFPAMATWSKRTSLQSARKLLELEPSVLAAGHGPMLVNPVTLMRKAAEEADRNLKAKERENHVAKSGT